jgi:hypothetical protein
MKTWEFFLALILLTSATAALARKSRSSSSSPAAAALRTAVLDYPAAQPSTVPTAYYYDADGTFLAAVKR